MDDRRSKVVFTSSRPDSNQLKIIREKAFTKIMTNCTNIDMQLLDEAFSNNLKVWVEVGCFVGEDLWEKYPQCRPIVNGNPVEKLGPRENKWYAGVLPLSDVIADRIAYIEKIILRYPGIEALYLDFCRFPGRWEDGEGQAILGDNMENDLSLRQMIITNFVQNVSKICHKYGVQLGIFLTPYDNRLYGQNLKELGTLCDYLSPMLYHKICRKPVDWIGEQIKAYPKYTRNLLLPIIQCIPEPQLISPAEFAKALEQTMQEGCLGMIIFFWEAMSPELRNFAL